MGALRGSFAAQKAEIASAHKGRTRVVVAAHQRDTKPEWAAQFRGERDGARERQRMERGLVGRVSLSIAAAREQQREQGGSFAKLVAVNFISKERRESAFAAASQRDRAVLSARLNKELGGRLEPVKDGRAFEMGQALERFKEDRGALVERQAGEWRKIREAWKQVGRERGAEPKRENSWGVRQGLAQEKRLGRGAERDRQAETFQSSRFAWLDRQVDERGATGRVAEPRPQVKQGPESRQPSRFDWLKRQRDPVARERGQQDRIERGKEQDQSDRER